MNIDTKSNIFLSAQVERSYKIFFCKMAELVLQRAFNLELWYSVLLRSYDFLEKNTKQEGTNGSLCIYYLILRLCFFLVST